MGAGEVVRNVTRESNTNTETHWKYGKIKHENGLKF